MRFSLVLATVNRDEELKRFLKSLKNQTHRNFELIVVDQNLDGRLDTILAAHADDFSIRHLKSAERGASKARNLGLKHVDGDLFAFPDDDCRYPPRLLENVARFFTEHEDMDGLAGRSVDEDGRTNMGRFDTQSGSISIENVWKRAISYTIFLRMEGIRGVWFDEELGVGAGTPWGSGEETDYLLQLMERGTPLYYDSEMTVVHSSPAFPYSAKEIRKAHSYGLGWGRLARKYKLPLRLKGRWLIRPLGGSMLSAAGLRLPEARHRWNTFKGRLKGMLP